MFICNDCGARFDEPEDAIYDYHPELGIGLCPEYHSACPHCQSFEFEEEVVLEDSEDYEELY